MDANVTSLVNVEASHNFIVHSYNDGSFTVPSIPSPIHLHRHKPRKYVHGKFD